MDTDSWREKADMPNIKNKPNNVIEAASQIYRGQIDY
jgi:hypothetical protein